MMPTVYVIRCNDETERIVDAVAYDTAHGAAAVAAAINAKGYNEVCGPHAVYPLRLIKEGD